MSAITKALSGVAVIAVIMLAPSISDRLNEEAASYVNDSDSAHDGLPETWVNSQALCVLFPSEAAHAKFSSGVTMIEFDGSTIGVNMDYNGTGACVGGFSGFENGKDLMDSAVNASSPDLSYNSTEFSFGLQIDSIGGIEPCDAYSCTDSSGAYWSLYHNGGHSMVGISDMILSEGDVVLWKIETW